MKLLALGAVALASFVATAAPTATATRKAAVPPLAMTLSGANKSETARARIVPRVELEFDPIRVCYGGKSAGPQPY